MAEAWTAEALLRDRRLRVTPQRQGVLQLFLTEPGRHWTADQIRSQLLGGMPGLARGTTYKVLEELVRSRICEEIAAPGGISLYGLRLAPHQHFVCSRCRRWFDVEADGLEHVVLVAPPPGAHVVEAAVVFHGLCGPCREAMNAASDAPTSDEETTR